MFKNLKLYYLAVSLPFILLLTGSAIFHNAISSTIVRNPHPQINYAIFCIIIFGGVLILLSVHRLMHEARTIVEYSRAIHANTDVNTLQKMADGYTGDIAYLLQMVATSAGRSISHQEQASLSHELANARTRITRRNALPQYLTGLLVGMGLLGTFVGLLATLSDISVLISSFSELDMTTASPLVVFRTMIDRMKAPMQSMSIAFSASMFGLLGSIVLGLMMVGIRRFQGDIVSLLSSEVARHIEIALSYEAAVPAKISGIVSANGLTAGRDDSLILLRIEERLAELARVQQRMLSSEIEDFQLQRGEMLRALNEQNQAANNFRAELQQMGRQFGAILASMEKGNNLVYNELSDLYVHLSADAKESHKLLAMQMEEQKRLRESIASYKIEERLAESARLQQKTLSAELDDFQKQRDDMLRTLAEQNEASNNFRAELQQLGRQLSTICTVMEKTNGEISAQLSELTVHLAADARESRNLMNQQIAEQKRLREALDWRTQSEQS